MSEIDNYIAECANEIQEKLFELKEIIMSVDNTLEQKMSWGMPTFYKKHNIIHFAANKNHIGIYPGGDAVEHFKDKLSMYKTTKGAIQIPNKQEIPKQLIIDIVKFNLGE